MKYKLKYPVVIPSTPDKPEVELTELNLVDQMKAKHAELIPDECFEGGQISPTKFIPVIASMANIDIKDVKELAFVDLVKIVGEIVSPFLSELGSQDEK
jgi:hypothetical protein